MLTGMCHLTENASWQSKQRPSNDKDEAQAAGPPPDLVPCMVQCIRAQLVFHIFHLPMTNKVSNQLDLFLYIVCVSTQAGKTQLLASQRLLW